MSRLGVVLRKGRSFFRYPLRSQLMMPVVFILLGIARMVILLIPFRYYANQLGTYRKTDIFTPILSAAQIRYSREIGRIVRATAAVTPWDSLCLVQAMVASLLLRIFQIPYILHFGLAKNTEPDDLEPMKAHAWVTSGPLAVTGERSLFKFSVVGSYVSPSLAGFLASLDRNNIEASHLAANKTGVARV